MIEVTLAAESATELARLVYDLACQMNPEMERGEASAETSPTPERRGRGRPRKPGVDSGAHPGPAGEVSRVSAPAEEPHGGEAVGRVDTGPGALQPQAPAENNLEGGAGAAAEGHEPHPVGTPAEPAVATFDDVERAAKQLAAAKGFAPVQGIFAAFQVKKLRDLPEAKYADALKAIREAMAA